MSHSVAAWIIRSHVSGLNLSQLLSRVPGSATQIISGRIWTDLRFSIELRPANKDL